jgi:hypothetical protein
MWTGRTNAGCFADVDGQIRFLSEFLVSACDCSSDLGHGARLSGLVRQRMK